MSPAEAPFALPDCREVVEDTLSADVLDAVGRSELIRRLAEQGVEGAHALVAERARADEALAQRLARLRERLRRQASRRVGRILEEYDRRNAELDQVRLHEKDRLDEEMRRLEERLRLARRSDLGSLEDPELLASVREALLAPQASWMRPPRRSLLARLKAWLLALWNFLRRLFGRRRRAEAPPRRERQAVFASLAMEGRTLDASAVGQVVSQLNPPERDELRGRVEDQLKSRERDLRKEAERKRREAEEQQRRLAEEREEARRRAEREADDQVREAEKRRIDRELKERGLVAERAGGLAVTYGLIERFARLLLEEETRSLPGEVRRSLRGAAPTGVYEKARLRQPEEVAHLDIPSSLVQARLEGSHHIEEQSSLIYREVTAERVHVVLIFDKSGSMAEGRKLEAAKKALLALYIAIRRRYPDATIDVAAFDNEVRMLDLVELWETPPGAFTNTGEALHVAHLLLRASRATRREVYLITDGLPEAYTAPDGRVNSGQLDHAMESALARAAELATVTPLVFTMILLKSDHPEYERAARLIARSLHGELVVTDPERLGFELLVRWAGGTETTRKASPAVPAPVVAETAATAARRKRRRADRRMGG
jgi:Mg-chelatase subunit ChlD